MGMKKKRIKIGLSLFFIRVLVLVLVFKGESCGFLERLIAFVGCVSI